MVHHERSRVITMIHSAVALFACALLGVACDADDSEVPAGVPESSDPRCAALCTDEQPEFEDAYDVCDADSLQTCVDLCEVRIEGAQNLCAECLLEGAVLDEPGYEEFDVCLADGSCFVGVPRVCHEGCWFFPSLGCAEECAEGEAVAEYQAEVEGGRACAYDDGDEEARAACHASINPREEVECSVEFEGVERCADVCG